MAGAASRDEQGQATLGDHSTSAMLSRLVSMLVPGPPRALSSANDAVVARDGPTLRSSWSHRRQVSLVVLAGRAIRVPQAAVTSGIQRTVTVTRRRESGWVHGPHLGWGRRPKLHGMQAVSTRF
jgi:hypothetical protein